MDAFHKTILMLLIFTYVLFIWLWSSVHKAERQRQIIQLSGAINGKAPEKQLKSSRVSRRNVVRKKGQYKALVESADANFLSDEEENFQTEADTTDSEFALDFVLTEPGDETDTDSVVNYA